MDSTIKRGVKGYCYKCHCQKNNIIQIKCNFQANGGFLMEICEECYDKEYCSKNNWRIEFKGYSYDKRKAACDWKICECGQHIVTWNLEHY